MAAGVEMERQRAQRYRSEAEQCRADAAKTIDLTIRPCLLQFAQLCEILADGIEARLGAGIGPNSDGRRPDVLAFHEAVADVVALFQPAGFPSHR